MARGLSAIEVLSAGTLTTVQDWPGRTGLWEVGVPPSGPMDPRSHRIANALVGNAGSAAVLEVTLSGPKLRFAVDATVAITGAPLAATLDGSPVPQWQALEVPAGSVLALGAIRGLGVRAYLAVRGGIDAPLVMGSRATFVAAGLGGRPLRRGDGLSLSGLTAAPALAEPFTDSELTGEHTLRVTLGPHGAPDFVTEAGLLELLDGDWLVHHHSDRTGIRLVGPQPRWARSDGGAAGLHPSNVLDSAYGVGTIMLAGDMAVVVGVDGPSLGGFVALAEVIGADLWRLGQLRAGGRVRLRAVDHVEAAAALALAERQFSPAGAVAGDGPAPGLVAAGGLAATARPVARFGPRRGAHGPLHHRPAGEHALLVEFGDPELDLRSRVRAHALRAALDDEAVPGLLDVTPGVRSLHIQFDPGRLSVAALVDQLDRLEAACPDPEALEIPGRIVTLPLAWRHSEAMRAVERYQASVRADAPWCPDNIDFIRRINGVEDEESLRSIVLDASYLVLGLGDVYLGAPVAAPLDPRHRLVTTKYNPARTWTPSNAVGIGGAFLCVYGIEGPGGYQLIGRTVPIWHATEEPQWRLRHFDQIRFELVAEPELEELRAASDAGSWRPSAVPASFSLASHERLVAAHAAEAEAFTRSREAAFARERAAWAAMRERAEAVA